MALNSLEVLLLVGLVHLDVSPALLQLMLVHLPQDLKVCTEVQLQLTLLYVVLSLKVGTLRGLAKYINSRDHALL